MKKINLRGISEILSEKELKNVMGGSDSGFCNSIYNGGYINAGRTCYLGSYPKGKCVVENGVGICKAIG